jgi:hypothetical protein
LNRILGRFSSTLLLLAAWSSAQAQLPPCYAGFEISRACIVERGLEQKVAAYQRKITEAMSRLGASYKIDLRPVNNPEEAGYDVSVGDVFTEVVRNQEMRNQAFIINVATDFLEKQPEILFEASSLHEVCHVINDDLTGYHRNGANIEVAEEYCVLQAVGEPRYKQYLQAYAAYRQYFKKHADGNEHLLVYNGKLYEATLHSTRNMAWHDTEKLKAVIKAGKPMIFFHNHPGEDGRAAMFPSYDDFGVAGLFSFMVYAENPDLAVEFRVMQIGQESTTVSYGFKGSAMQEIRQIALEYRNALGLQADVGPIEMKQKLLDYHLAQDSFSDYLQYACPVDLARKDADVCRTHPKNFLWPSDRFFVHYRPQ